MSDIKYKDYILEAIDQLRRRKARPDVHRICNFLMRKFAISYVDAKRDLQKCVDQEVVLRVEYKGNISYRNAAKKFLQIKREGDSPPNGTKPNRKFVGLLTNAIAELIVQEPDYLEMGVPGPELIRNILSKDNVRYTKKYVNILLDKEVESGGLIKMENGNYLVGPVRPEESLNKDKAIIETVVVKCEPDVPPMIYRKQSLPDIKQGVKKEKMENKHSDETIIYPSNENGNLRVGSRRKRAKKVFDPSDNNLPKRRGRPMGSLNKSTIEKQIHKYPDTDSRPESRSSITSSREQGGVCSVCHNNKRVPNDRFVTCRECSNKAHVNCLNGDDMMLKMYPDNSWQCPHCKTCCICYETSDAGCLTVCSVCADAYHSACHDPPILEKTKGTTKWLCINCQMPDQLQISEIHPNVSSGDIVFTHKSIIEDGESNQDSQSCKNKISTSSASPVMSTSDDSNHNSLPPSPTPPTLSPQPNHLCSIASPETRCAIPDSINIKEEPDIEDLIDPSIPDASNWTSDDVYNYFVQYFPEEAKVFKEQEIDGCSLLLMKRMDVLTSLKLKLGPALKIYRHIVKLQFRRDDPKLYWL